MATAAAIFNHQMTAGQALTRPAETSMASSTTGTSGSNNSDDSSASSATISANDFLTLLVTEMQNQDPTADTDPNEYINQLVQVNSLEQLIDINQTLTTDLGSTSSTTTSGATAQATSNPAGAVTAVSSVASPRTSLHAGGSSLAASPHTAPTSTFSSQASSAQRIAGNLSAPNTSPAAQRVGHALAGRTHAAVGEGIALANQ
jgi:flagellar basal-body rod modification protein FlgD